MENKVADWTVKFGKYKGEKFSDLPDEYVEWLLESNFFLKPSTVENIELRERYNKTNKMINDYLIYKSMSDED